MSQGVRATKGGTAGPERDKAFGTDPLDESGLSLPPSDPVTALRVVGQNIELPLSSAKRTFTLGAAAEPEVDLTVPSAVSARVSRLHALIQRKANRLWVNDQHSTNGTYLRDRREPSFEIGAGQSFRIADVKLLALDEHLRVLRPHVQWILGLTAHAAVDAALELIADGGPLLLLGRPGCDQLALVREIHRTSARRQRALVEAPARFETRAEQTSVLTHASRGTIYLDLATINGPLPAFFVSHLFGETYHVRPIVSAPSLEKAEDQLGKERTPDACRSSTSRRSPSAARTSPGSSTHSSSRPRAVAGPPSSATRMWRLSATTPGRRTSMTSVATCRGCLH
jgi:hypothetical protein